MLLTSSQEISKGKLRKEVQCFSQNSFLSLRRISPHLMFLSPVAFDPSISLSSSSDLRSSQLRMCCATLASILRALAKISTWRAEVGMGNPSESRCASMSFTSFRQHLFHQHSPKVSYIDKFLHEQQFNVTDRSNSKRFSENFQNLRLFFFFSIALVFSRLHSTSLPVVKCQQPSNL